MEIDAADLQQGGRSGSGSGFGCGSLTLQPNLNRPIAMPPALEAQRRKSVEILERVRRLPSAKLSCECRRRLEKAAKNEIKFLDSLAERFNGTQQLRAHLQSSNLNHLEAVLRTIEHPSVASASAVLRTVTIANDTTTKPSSAAADVPSTTAAESSSTSGQTVHVDVSCVFGGVPAWLLVSARNPRFLSYHVRHGSGRDGGDGGGVSDMEGCESKEHANCSRWRQQQQKQQQWQRQQKQQKVQESIGASSNSDSSSSSKRSKHRGRRQQQGIRGKIVDALAAARACPRVQRPEIIAFFFAAGVPAVMACLLESEFGARRVDLESGRGQVGGKGGEDSLRVQCAAPPNSVHREGDSREGVGPVEDADGEGDDVDSMSQSMEDEEEEDGDFVIQAGGFEGRHSVQREGRREDKGADARERMDMEMETGEREARTFTTNSAHMTAISPSSQFPPPPSCMGMSGSQEDMVMRGAHRGGRVAEGRKGETTTGHGMSSSCWASSAACFLIPVGQQERPQPPQQSSVFAAVEEASGGVDSQVAMQQGNAAAEQKIAAGSAVTPGAVVAASAAAPSSSASAAVPGSCNSLDVSSAGRVADLAFLDGNVGPLPAEMALMWQSVPRINLDVTAMVAMVSELTNGGADRLLSRGEEWLRQRFKGNWQFMKQQATADLANPLLQELQAACEGRLLLLCATALREFSSIVRCIAGVRERERTQQLMQQLRLIPDQACSRLDSLLTSARIKERHRIIFGTGASWRCPTLTANSSFVRAARQAGAMVEIVEHRPCALCGE